MKTQNTYSKKCFEEIVKKYLPVG